MNLTKTEQSEVRALLRDDLCDIVIGENDDGTWFAEIYGHFLEGTSPRDVLLKLAEIAGDERKTSFN